VLPHAAPSRPPALPFPPPVFPPASPVSLPPVTWSSPTPYPRILVGRVRQHSRAEGYGIIGTPNGTEYPFHDSSLIGLPSVLDNTDVAFEAAPMLGGGAFAVNVRPLVGPTLSTTAPAPPQSPLTAPPPRRPTPPSIDSPMSAPTIARPSSITKLGYVRFYYEKKDYGFILGSGGEDCFFARSALEDDNVDGLQGAVVAFETTVGRKGLQACRIRRVAAELVPPVDVAQSSNASPPEPPHAHSPPSFPACDWPQAPPPTPLLAAPVFAWDVSSAEPDRLLPPPPSPFLSTPVSAWDVASSDTDFDLATILTNAGLKLE
jgi:cold shock CspA family protein